MIQFIKEKFEYKDSWNLSVDVVFYGKKQSLNICVDGEGDINDFEDEQKKVLNYLKNNLNHVLLIVESKVFQYYTSNHSSIESSLAKNKRLKDAPYVSSKLAMSELVVLKNIIIPYCFEPEEIEFGVALDCSWDPSHGLGVLFQNFEYLEIGSFDIING
ncbi:hypothetical protein V5096_19310 [Pseudoalteromonas carrageenovora]|uniref:DUF6985 domain-containing protein n=1 Tax=Pseudoalteromonas carrageenovora TaxID=227 RepID=UPI002FCFA1E8